MTIQSPTPIVKGQNLSKVFGYTNALKSVSFTINKGEIVGLVGKNGAGKSTLLKIIALLIKPSNGNLLLFGNEIKEDSHLIKQDIEIILNQSFFYSELTGRENLAFFYKLNKRIKNPDKIIEQMIKDYNLKLFIDRPVYELSTGMKKKLEILRAVLPKPPKLLLLDEPFSGLDFENKRFLRDLIINNSEDTAIILCSHNLTTISQLCNKVIYVSKGKIDRILEPSDYKYFLEDKE